MLSEGQKRRASLNILDRLRSKGMPERAKEDEMNSMFELLAQEDGTPEGEAEGELSEEPTETKKKKKKPTLDESKVDKFTKGFKSVF